MESINRYFKVTIKTRMLSAKHRPQPLSWRCSLISSLLQCRKVNSCGNDTAQLTSDGSQAGESVI